MDTQPRSRKDKQARSQSRSKSTSRSKSPRKPTGKRAANKSTSNASSVKSPSKSKASARPKSISKSPLSRKKRESTATASASKGAKVYTKKEMSEQKTSPTPAKRTTRSASQASTSPKRGAFNNQGPLVSLFEDSRLKQEIEELKSSDVVPRKKNDIDLSDVRDYVLRKRQPPNTSSTPYRAGGARLAQAAKQSTCKFTACTQWLWWPVWSRINSAWIWTWKRLPAKPKWLVARQQKWTRAGYLRFNRTHVWQFVAATVFLVFFLWLLNFLNVSKFDPIKFTKDSATSVYTQANKCMWGTWDWTWSWTKWGWNNVASVPSKVGSWFHHNPHHQHIKK